MLQGVLVGKVNLDNAGFPSTIKLSTRPTPISVPDKSTTRSPSPAPLNGAAWLRAVDLFETLVRVFTCSVSSIPIFMSFFSPTSAGQPPDFIPFPIYLALPRSNAPSKAIHQRVRVQPTKLSVHDDH
ncbi:uncharacterized protein CLUP02_00530 [Colletotrichum lupini]|uniref:Uncharacterized protein n=1 Tax=Colletotrichum lupini TaxID=145971 RepID=A0A9Q8W792_9PEZI|nr:uncharacterized protein CLUP02_00530 [Colletotrichum lupini]UQC73883.1 hypothetical protein CLUP02_00530 [Colletotrichum lupini]